MMLASVGEWQDCLRGKETPLHRGRRLLWLVQSKSIGRTAHPEKRDIIWDPTTACTLFLTWPASFEFYAQPMRDELPTLLILW